MIVVTKHLRSLALGIAVSACISVASFAPSALAQTSLGTLTGVVRDASGAVVTNAELSVTNLANGDVRKVKTSELGAYRFDALTPGHYRLHTEATGFQQFDLGDIVIPASQVVSYDPSMKVGAQSETVSVSADQVLLDKENGSLSSNIPAEALAKMPIFSLNPIEVLTTVPGVQLVSNSDMSNGQSIQVSGARPRSNNFMIDGQEMNDAGIGGQAVQPNIPDMYADTVVYTHSAPAEFGRASGGVVNLISKGGSNNFHGSAWELYSGSGLEAVDGQTRLLPPDHGNKARYNQHQYGFTVGGPVIKDKLFAFGAAQWSRFYGNAVASQIYLPNSNGVALLNQIAGGSGVTATNAALLLNYLSGASYLKTFDDFSVANGDAPGRTKSLGAACPASSPNCALEIDLYRRPTTAQQNPDTQWNYRIDFSPRSADTFTARYLHDRSSLTPDFFTNGIALPGFDTFQGGPSELGSGAWTHIFTPNLLNEFRVAETRLGYFFQPTAESIANPLFKSPNLVFSNEIGDASAGLGFDQNFPQGRGQDMYQFQDTISWTHGRHTVRAGVDIGRRIEKDLVSQNANGNLSFAAGGTGVSKVGNFLLDQLGPSGSANITYGSTRLDPHSWRSGVFAQDDFKVNPDLTLNFGLRYDYFTAPENALAYPSLNAANPFAPINTVLKVTPDKNNFGPRFGFAFTPHQGVFANGKTVVRGGFGVFFDSDFTNIAINSAQSSPNAVAGTLISTKGNGLTGATGLLSQIPKTLNPRASVTSVVNNLASPYSYEYNLGVERELPWQIGVSATYVGTRGVKLFANQQYNYFSADTGLRLDPTRGAINARGNFAASDYNGLEVGVKRNFSKGLALYGSYTYSKSLDNGSEVFTPDSASTSYSADLAPGGRRFDWGNSAYDHRHYAAITYVWTPMGFRADNHGTDLVLSALTRHWTVSGTSRFQSGAYSTVNMLGLDMNFDGSVANDRPLVGNPSAPMDSVGIDGYWVSDADGNPGTEGVYYDLAANNTTGALNPLDANKARWLITAGPVPFQKEIGRNSYLNPGQLYNDVALEKAVPTSWFHLDRGQFILRAEARNIANHNNVDLLDVNLLDVGSSSFLNTQDARMSNTANHRSLRFWAKFVF